MGRQPQPDVIRSFLKSLFQPAPRVIRETSPVAVTVTIEDHPYFALKAEAQQLRQDGHSLRYIAAELGISYYMARKCTMA